MSNQVIITKENSEYNGMKGKIHSETEEGLLEIYLPELENILTFNKSDVELEGNGTKRLKAPRSRKSFYTMVQSNCSREDICTVLKMLVKDKKFVFHKEGLSEKSLLNFVKNPTNTKQDIVEYIRSFKISGDAEFTLPANDYVAPQNMNKKKRKKNIEHNY